MPETAPREARRLARSMKNESLPIPATGAEMPSANAAANGVPTPTLEAAAVSEVVPPAPSGTVDASRRSLLQLAFAGVADDYFRIWIVNLLLTLVTVGLWSPWAKVRKRRYFYGHTWLANANFEYHGNPVRSCADV